MFIPYGISTVFCVWKVNDLVTVPVVEAWSTDVVLDAIVTKATALASFVASKHFKLYCSEWELEEHGDNPTWNWQLL